MRLWCLCHCCCGTDAWGGLSHRPAMAIPCLPPLLLHGGCSGGSSGSAQPLLGDTWGSSRNQLFNKNSSEKNYSIVPANPLLIQNHLCEETWLFLESPPKNELCHTTVC